MLMNKGKHICYLVIAICFLFSCNSNGPSRNQDNKVQTSDSLNDYPKIIIKNGLQKGYDNAVWLLYASNYHGKIYCISRIKKAKVEDSLLIRYEPLFRGIQENKDSIEIGFLFKKIIDGDTCVCYPKQYYMFADFVFIKGKDSIIYRRLGWDKQMDDRFSMLN
jgi:hypothetical protein